MNWIDILGILAAIGTTSSFVPQAWRVFRTRKTSDLSLMMFILFTAGVALWLVYGLLIMSVPVIAANAVTLVLAFYILVMKIRLG